LDLPSIWHLQNSNRNYNKYTQIERKNYLGLENYDFQYFDGFQTSIVNSKSGNFEYLYLLKDNQKIIKMHIIKTTPELKEISINLKI
jgi:hypothetical protein